MTLHRFSIFQLIYRPTPPRAAHPALLITAHSTWLLAFLGCPRRAPPRVGARTTAGVPAVVRAPSFIYVLVGGGIWREASWSGAKPPTSLGVGNTPWRKKSARPSHFRCTLLPTGGDTHTLWTAKESGGSKHAASAPNVSRLAQSSATTLGV